MYQPLRLRLILIFLTVLAYIPIDRDYNRGNVMYMRRIIIGLWVFHTNGLGKFQNRGGP